MIIESQVLECFVFDGERETLNAMTRSKADWVIGISCRATWAQRDWYPRLLKCLNSRFCMLVPVTNEPAPDWQAAGPSGDDMVVHHKIAEKCTGGIVDVTQEPETAVPAVAIVRRSVAHLVLLNGLAEAQSLAAKISQVGLVQSVYVVHHA